MLFFVRICLGIECVGGSGNSFNTCCCSFDLVSVGGGTTGLGSVGSTGLVSVGSAGLVSDCVGVTGLVSVGGGNASCIGVSDSDDIDL